MRRLTKFFGFSKSENTQKEPVGQSPQRKAEEESKYETVNLADSKKTNESNAGLIEKPVPSFPESQKSREEPGQKGSQSENDKTEKEKSGFPAGKKDDPLKAWKFSKGKYKEIYKVPEIYSRGLYGISWKRESIDFLIAGPAGSASLLNGATGQLKRIQRFFPIRRAATDWIECSPKGRNVLFVNQQGKSFQIIVFDSKTFLIKKKWTKNPKNQEIVVARWMNELTFLVILKEDNEAEMSFYNVSGSQQITKILAIDRPDQIQDIDFSSDRKFLYFGIRKKAVKLSTENQIARYHWFQDGKEGMIEAIRVSDDGKYVGVTTNHRKLQMLLEKNGNPFASFKGFSEPNIWGIFWCPKTPNLLVWSSNEICLLGFKDSEDERARLVEVDRKNYMDIFWSDMNAVSVVWGRFKGEIQNLNPLIIVGMKNGRIFRLPLDKNN